MLETSHEVATRSCVGCRKTDSRDVLLRFVAVGQPSELFPDVRRKLPGRGASVHASYRCLATAVRTGALRRALDVQVETPANVLAQTAVAQYMRRAEGLLQAARRAKHIAVGTEAVRDALAQRRVHLLIVAADAEGSRQDLERTAEKLGRACLVWNTKDGLGRLFGRTTLSVLAILDEGIADQLRQALHCVAELAPCPPTSVPLSAAEES